MCLDLETTVLVEQSAISPNIKDSQIVKIVDTERRIGIPFDNRDSES